MNEFGNPLKNLWDRKNKTLIYHTPIFDLVSFDVTNKKNQKIKPYYVLEAKNWVNSIAITKDKKIILIRQYRHGLHEYSIEIPGGIVDDEGEDAALISAKRELAEETGYTSKEWKLIGRVSGNPAVFNNYSYTYLALDAELTQDVDWDEGEEIEIFTRPIQEIPELIRNGTIHHSMMVAALGMYFFYGQD
jgi:8-oxo-dGTP pyrophosphatase MutT (NUDIX family)